MQAQGSWPCPGKGLCCLEVPGPSPRLSQSVAPPALASVAAPQHAGHTHVGVSVHTHLGHVHMRVQRVLESPSSRVGAGGTRLHLQAQHRPWLRSGGGVGAWGCQERSHRLPSLVPHPRKAPAAGCVRSPLASLTRFPPGAGLMERIQAIAQNVSDIATKVDQILRHSLVLHSKGAAQGTPLAPGGQCVGRP